jgi:hypothetical protein
LSSAPSTAARSNDPVQRHRIVHAFEAMGSDPPPAALEGIHDDGLARSG